MAWHVKIIFLMGDFSKKKIVIQYKSKTLCKYVALPMHAYIYYIEMHIPMLTLFLPAKIAYFIFHS